MPGTEFGPPLNMFAMWKNLIEQNLGFFTTTTAPTNGTSGTFAGYAGPGAMLFDTSTGTVYFNIGTLASPVWNVGTARSVSVTLTNAQILALRAAPVTLVAAPGAGFMHEFISAELILNATAGAYTETADNLAVRFVNGAGVIVSQAIEMTGFIDQAAQIRTNALAKIDTIATQAQADNQPLVLHNTGDGEFGGGNAANSLIVRVSYRTHATT